ncbi:MAG: transglycosylase domain-containing protein, partial [Mucinivorans sp.]
MQQSRKPTLADRARRPRREQRAFKIFWTIVIAPFALMLLMVLLAICGAFGSLPSFEELENRRSNIATEIISSDGESLGGYYVENRSYTDYADLSPSLVAALVATEDARFYSHSG